jgi:hypothetical protein
MSNSRRDFLKAISASGVGGVLTGALCVKAGEQALPPATVGTVAKAGIQTRYLGRQFRDNDANVTGADGATSLRLPNGTALWVFGDTVEGPFESIRGLDLTPMRSNTAAIVRQQDASAGIKDFDFLVTDEGKRPRQIIPFSEGEDPATTRLWAIHGAAVGATVYLFYHRISLLAGVDVFEDFRLEGMGLARAAAADLVFTRLTTSEGSKEFWKGDQPTFGVWVEKTDDYISVWGSLMTGMFLARVRPQQIERPKAYEYLVEAPTLEKPTATVRWERQFQPTAVLFDSVPNEMSAAFNPYLKRHVAIHSLGREGQIVMRTAPLRTVPWRKPVVIYEVKREKPADKVYAAKEHPELARENGRKILVTFVNSGSYIPELVEVTFP